jgi:hypothetical protein
LQLLALTAISFVLVPAAALAATPSQHQYVSSLQQLSQGGPGGLPDGSASSAGSLPFTGLDVLLLAAVAAALLCAGLVLRRGRPEVTRD